MQVITESDHGLFASGQMMQQYPCTREGLSTPFKLGLHALLNPTPVK